MMKHRNVKHLLFWALLAVCLVALPLFNEAACPKKDKGKECKMGQCSMLANIPNLSAEQKSKIEALCQEQMKGMMATKEAMAKQHEELAALMAKPDDKQRIEAKIDEIAKMQADMMKKCFAHRLEIRGLLTDEQKAKFDVTPCCGMGGCMMKCEKSKDKCQEHKEKGKESVK